jgi:YfaZ precursor
MRSSLMLYIGLALFAAQFATAQPATTNAVERSVELALSDETVQARYRAPTDTGGQPNSEVAYGVFLSEDRDVVGSAALLFGTNLDLGAFHVQLGPQAYAALLEEENEDVFALSVGGQVRFDVIPSRGLAIVGSGFWSPDILTFGSADNVSDLMARVEMRLADPVIGFVGYRWFTLDLLEREDRDLQSELFAGINWRLR